MTLANVVIILLVTTSSISAITTLSSAVICSPELNKCYQYFTKLVTFWEAERNCTALGGHLPSIHSWEENDFVFSIGQLVSQQSSRLAYWIGGYLWYSGWRWTDQTPFDYANWGSDPYRDNIGQDGYKGVWNTMLNGTQLPFICTLPETLTRLQTTTLIPRTSSTTQTRVQTTTPIYFSRSTSTQNPVKQCVSSCDLGWTYLGSTDSCYKVFHNAEWSEAELQCRSYGAHLTSIHSDTENTFVNNLASTGNKRVNVSSLAWIGMQKIYGQWVWTDGTYVDYFQWAPKQPDNLQTELCVQTASDMTDNGWYQEWNNLDCNVETRAYICKKASYHQ